MFSITKIAWTVALSVVTLQLTAANAAINGTGSYPDIKLTRFGKRLKNVVIAAVQYEGVCASGRYGEVSWRGSLPKYLARILRPEATVIVWNGREAARNESLMDDCELCKADSPIASENTKFACRGWFQQGLAGSEHADLVVVIGTGMKRRCKECVQKLNELGHYGELKLGLSQPWVGRKTKRIHIPISRTSKVLENQVASFNKVLPDSQWVKPVHLHHISTWREGCKGSEKTSSLVYVASFKEMKGQLEFLRIVDPELLKGYTIRFFGTGGSRSEMSKAQEVARSRGISIQIQKSAVQPEHVLTAMCSARGAIHYAKSDANPRVLYEAITAGLPVLITSESRFPDAVRHQPFIFPVQYGDVQQLNASMSNYMAMVRADDPAVADKIDRFVDQELEEEKALNKVCAMMGICKWPV